MKKNVNPACAFAMLIFFTGAIQFAIAQSGGFCSQTARTLFAACKADVTDDTLVGKAICLNVSDSAERDACTSELSATRKDSLDECSEMLQWRLESCKLIGEDRYDPQID